MTRAAAGGDQRPASRRCPACEPAAGAGPSGQSSSRGGAGAPVDEQRAVPISPSPRPAPGPRSSAATRRAALETDDRRGEPVSWTGIAGHGQIAQALGQAAGRRVSPTRCSSTSGCRAAQRRWNSSVCRPIADHACPIRSRVCPVVASATRFPASASTCRARASTCAPAVVGVTPARAVQQPHAQDPLQRDQRPGRRGLGDPEGRWPTGEAATRPRPATSTRRRSSRSVRLAYRLTDRGILASPIPADVVS